jgi:hypothetical protein
MSTSNAELTWPVGLLARLLALLVFFASSAQGQGGVRFVLVAGADQDLTRRLVAEAKQAGFDIVVQQAEQHATSSELARQSHAVGVLRVTGPAAVELWLVGDAEQPPSAASFRQQSGEAEGFAVRVIEETRSRVVALHLPESTPAPAPAELARSRLQSVDAGSPKQGGLDLFDAGAGVAVTKATGLGATLHAELHARARLAPRIGAGAFALVPFATNEFSGAEGTGRASVYLFGAGADWLAWQPTSAFATELGAGAGAVWLPLHAEPSVGYSAHADHLAAALAFASTSLDLRLTSWLGLRTSVLVGSSLPRPVVRFDGRQMASWGHFFAVGSAALEVTAPE